MIYETISKIRGFQEFMFTSLFLLNNTLFFLMKTKLSNTLFKHKKGNKYNLDLQGNKILLLITWLLVPIIIPFLISQILAPIYQIRYTISASVAFYILIALAIEKIKIRHIKTFFYIFNNYFFNVQFI